MFCTAAARTTRPVSRTGLLHGWSEITPERIRPTELEIPMPERRRAAWVGWIPTEEATSGR